MVQKLACGHGDIRRQGFNPYQGAHVHRNTRLPRMTARCLRTGRSKVQTKSRVFSKDHVWSVHLVRLQCGLRHKPDVRVILTKGCLSFYI